MTGLFGVNPAFQLLRQFQELPGTGRKNHPGPPRGFPLESVAIRLKLGTILKAKQISSAFRSLLPVSICSWSPAGGGYLVAVSEGVNHSLCEGTPTDLRNNRIFGSGLAALAKTLSVFFASTSQSTSSVALVLKGFSKACALFDPIAAAASQVEAAIYSRVRGASTADGKESPGWARHSAALRAPTRPCTIEIWRR